VIKFNRTTFTETQRKKPAMNLQTKIDARSENDPDQNDYPLRYTLCFLRYGNQFLMLHRKNSPNRGLWNGVGGHIEAGEAPLACCIREVQEETGYTGITPEYKGLMTWDGFETGNGSLCIFTATVNSAGHFPVEMDEGRLEWKPIEWVFSSDEVVSNIHYFGPEMINHSEPRRYHFSYREGHVLQYQKFSLPEWARI
jgi:8-oxo-dGTP diphosphatase